MVLVGLGVVRWWEGYEGGKGRCVMGWCWLYKDGERKVGYGCIECKTILRVFRVRVIEELLNCLEV